MKKSNTGSTNLFLLFRFRRFRGAKVVFFLFVRAKSWFFLGLSIGVFRVCVVGFGVFPVGFGENGGCFGGCGFQMRRLRYLRKP